jgi:hypothetical protein
VHVGVRVKSARRGSVGAEEVHRAYVKLKSVPSGARRTIRFDKLNDPRPGGRANPKEGRGLSPGVVSELDFSCRE